MEGHFFSKKKDPAQLQSFSKQDGEINFFVD